jgi:hypothetical protein
MITKGSEMTADAPYLLNPANQAYLDGTKSRPQFNSQSGCLALFFCFFAAIGLVFTLLVISDIISTLRLSLSGAVGQAVIVDTEIDDSGDSTSYVLVYEYRVAGQVYTQRDTVDRNRYVSTDIGDSVEILYLPTQPTDSRLGSERPVFRWLWLVIVLTGGFAVGGGMAVRHYWRLARKEQQAAARGARIDGRVISAQQEKDSDGDLWITIEYEITSPTSGAPLRETQKAPLAKDRALPRVGSRVAVLYADDTHYALL